MEDSGKDLHVGTIEGVDRDTVRVNFGKNGQATFWKDGKAVAGNHPHRKIRKQRDDERPRTSEPFGFDKA